MANNQKANNLNDNAVRVDMRTASDSRCCFVSRKRLPRARMLRFVYDTDHRLYLDIAEKLPGRGIWLSLEKDTLFTGTRYLLEREGRSRTTEDFLKSSTRLLEQRCLSYLSLARRAGLAVSGAATCLHNARVGALRALLCMHGASLEERRKILRAKMGGEERQLDRLNEPLCFPYFTAEGLGKVFSREQVIYAGLCLRDGYKARGNSAGLMQRVLEELHRLASFSVSLVSMQKGNEVGYFLAKDCVRSNGAPINEDSNYVGR